MHVGLPHSCLGEGEFFFGFSLLSLNLSGRAAVNSPAGRGNRGAGEVAAV